MSEVNIDADRLAAAFIKIRTKREELKRKYDEEDSVMKEKMEALRRVMLDMCKEINADSIKTGHGTIMRSIKTRYWTQDWTSMRQFILDNAAPELLEQRIAQRNMAQWLEENPEKVPPGLNQDREYDATVRKS